METIEDKLARLELMADGDPKWDLSDHDQEAIAWLLAEYKKLRHIDSYPAIDADENEHQVVS